MLNNRTRRNGGERCLRGMRRLLVVFVAILLGGDGLVDLQGQDSGDRQKKVFVHHMGSMNAGRAAMAWHTRNPDLGDPASSNGGDYRSLPLVPYEMYNLSLEESADLQIRQAMRIGIDGFAVNAWAGGDEAKAFLDALFKVAEEKNYPFEISICPDPSAIPQTTGLTDAIADAVRYLLDRHGNSPKLARRDGKPIIFGYQSNFLWVHYLEQIHNYDRNQVDLARTTEEGWSLVGAAYSNLEQLVGQPLYIQFDMGAFFHGLQTQGIPENGYVRAAEVISRHLPAVTEFLPSGDTGELSRLVPAAGAEWGQPIYMNYDNPRINWSHGGPGTDELRRRWQEARDSNATLLQLTTWNDYHENTNIAPGTNNNYAYFDLTGYFIEWWKTGVEPEPSHDRVYVFSRKYPRGTRTYPHQDYAGTDGVIEVLTILPEPARIRVPGRGEYDAPAGLFHRHFPVTPGPVSAELIRDGAVQLVVESPEPVADLPFRQDNGITGISSECASHWQADFAGWPQEFYSEYGDIDSDGLPNWFEMYWFGHFGDFSTAVGADPNTDVNGDGYTNRDAFVLQRSPVATNASVGQSAYTGSPTSLPGRIETEFFDHGGPGVAYHDATGLNEGGHFRPDEHVGIGVTSDIEGGYNVGWTSSGEWLEYTVNVEAAGLYDIHFRVASQEDGGAVRLQVDGNDLVESMEIPNTGGWQAWQTVSVPGVTIAEGEQTLRVVFDAGGFNLNHIEFEAKAVHYPPVVAMVSPGPGAIFTTGDMVDILVEASSPESRIARVEFVSEGGKLGEVFEEPYFLSTAELPAGLHSITAIATDVAGLSTTAGPVEIEVRQGRAPFLASAHTLPGVIRAKDFDLGGQGVAYFDSTSTNEGGGYRPGETVDLEATSDYIGGYNVGWTVSGEWMLYTVNVTEAGIYDLRARVSANQDDRSFQIDFDEGDPNQVEVPNTGGWQNWETVTVAGVNLRKGLQSMRLLVGTGGFNINYIEAELVVPAMPEPEFLNYASWQEKYFSPEELQNSSISGATADVGGNGVPNLMQYALNRRPHETGRDCLPRPGKIIIDQEEFLSLTFSRPMGIQDLNYYVEVSSDSINWQSGAAHVVPVSVTPEGSSETVVVRDVSPMGAFDTRLLRLRVERAI